MGSASPYTIRALSERRTNGEHSQDTHLGHPQQVGIEVHESGACVVTAQSFPDGGIQLSPSFIPRLLCTPVFHIDANLINARQKLSLVNQLEKWYEDGVILINMSSVAHAEAQAGSSSARVRKANTHIFTATEPFEPTDPLFKHIEKALFPAGATNENQRNDIKVVCEAVKYHAILITADGASKSPDGHPNSPTCGHLKLPHLK